MRAEPMMSAIFCTRAGRLSDLSVTRSARLSAAEHQSQNRHQGTRPTAIQPPTRG
jgi:hypothetical protein